MRIAFDAKRAYHNNTGLGNYSRTLITDLAEYFPENHYFLLNPKPSKRYSFDRKNIHEILPKSFLSKHIPPIWRSKWMVKDLLKLDIDLYHGLSHEIPFEIQNTRIKTVVTIHDLIFERFPEQYKPLDVKLYRRKYRYACQHANRIIAISEQTKRDIVELYQINPAKIEVCYQSCGREFNLNIPEESRQTAAQKYNLPKRFFLSVGSIIERKNLLNICKAVSLLNKDVPLVVIGKGGGQYRQKIEDYIRNNKLEKQIIFLSDVFKDISELPEIYSLAEALIYPSYYEGFGIPVLEALRTGVPVITSNVSCLPEAGGDAALYANPDKPEEIAVCMTRVLEDKNYTRQMIKKGLIQAERFSNLNCAAQVMDTYMKVMSTD